MSIDRVPCDLKNNVVFCLKIWVCLPYQNYNTSLKFNLVLKFFYVVLGIFHVVLGIFHVVLGIFHIVLGIYPVVLGILHVE